ncbi:MAG TPA: nitrate reductase cytochrome c-type subunit [Casimicrobiaceae bacterium]|nr:nitrate reductase cytochrome c-type subunit [Casimicrobiaceae bacterium]
MSGRRTARCVAGVALAAFVACAWAAQPAQPALADPLRGPTPILDEPHPPPLQNQENKDVRRVRSHPMQPPTIPHKIDGYQLDRDVNRCLFCHARARIEETRAIPLSVTHYMDRDGNVRGDVSPRRYFCTQCHVPQDEVKPLVENRFEDFETASRRAPAPAGKR